MGRKAFTAEQIIFKLREVEVLVGQGASIAEACRKIAVTEQTYYRWRKEYGGKGCAVITTLARAGDALAGIAGTRIVPDSFCSGRIAPDSIYERQVQNATG